VKASSGYAFTSIQRHSQKIVERLQRQQHPAIAETLADKKFSLFDRVLLHVLLSKKLNGDTIFGLIFKHNTPETVFRFLDNRSNLLEDLQIMRSVPTGIFLPAALKEMLGKQ
jgi:lycopene beta-cyclase